MSTVLPPGDDSSLLEELALEYRRLFVLTLSPHESVQRGEGQLWGTFTTQVKAEIENLGLFWRDGREFLPDHLAVELEVMQHLTEVEAVLLELGGEEAAIPARTRQRLFLRNHLLQWAPDYLHAVAANAAQPFYAALARLTSSFLMLERD